jgi:DNA (cytosine-5)-methyltransferase 1
VTRAYYNEHDPYAAAWLRELIAAGLIAGGDVDERDIRDVRPGDLAGYRQHHFFAGIGVWSYALRLAGWSDAEPVWTGSCPCQPFSSAGGRAGFADERHLWPAWHWLIRECRPATVFGEQVASKDGLDWLALVHADMARAGYRFGADDLPAAGVGAPHIRQRLWWVADAAPRGRREQRDALVARSSGHADGGEQPRGMGDAGPSGLPLRERADLRGEGRRGEGRAAREPSGAPGGVANADGGDASAEREQRGGQHGQQPGDGGVGIVADAMRGRACAGVQPPAAPTPAGGAGRRIGAELGDSYSERAAGSLHGFWRDADWILCRDGKWRPVEPGAQPLAHGVAGQVAVVRPGADAEEAEAVRWVSRTGTLRGAGNAIVAQVAAAFIEEYRAARVDLLL